MDYQLKKTAIALSVATLLCLSFSGVSAQEHSHSHDGKQAQLTLNEGKKWVTDAHLKKSMEIIRDTLASELTAIHSGKATDEQYRILGQKINDQIAFIVKKCNFDKRTDAMLHIVLADIIAGVEGMMTHDPDMAYEGAKKIAHALENYGAYFNHPGWHTKPL